MIRYPNVAAEILNSELWVIPETILSNKETLLRPFWDAVVPPLRSRPKEPTAEDLFEEGEVYRARTEFGTDEDDERDRKREVIRGLWVKVNGGLITKRTTEVSCAKQKKRERGRIRAHSPARWYGLYNLFPI